MADAVSWRADDRGRVVLERMERLVAGLNGHLGRQAAVLMARHGYRVDGDGSGPHRNALGHPLFDLPIWLAGDRVEETVLLDVCEASLCGYLSVRCDDDYFDGAWDDGGAAMILSGVFRARHQALLAPLTGDRRFWDRFGEVWRDYGEAMLLERSLHHPAARYGKDEFALVLLRSQPLEIPGNAVLAITGRWELAGPLAELVRHLNTATQLFDDFVDAPADLEAENITWMVRRLGGLKGPAALRRGMISAWDAVAAEIDDELEEAVRIGDELGLDDMRRWVVARRQLIERATKRMYRVLFRGETGEPAGVRGGA